MMNVLLLVLILGGIIAGWMGYRRLLAEVAALHARTTESVDIQRRREKAVEHLKTSEGRELLRARLRQRLGEHEHA